MNGSRFFVEKTMWRSRRVRVWAMGRVYREGVCRGVNKRNVAMAKVGSCGVSMRIRPLQGRVSTRGNDGVWTFTGGVAPGYFMAALRAARR
jgi:hypothetical protein